MQDSWMLFFGKAPQSFLFLVVKTVMAGSMNLLRKKEFEGSGDDVIGLTKH